MMSRSRESSSRLYKIPASKTDYMQRDGACCIDNVITFFKIKSNFIYIAYVSVQIVLQKPRAWTLTKQQGPKEEEKKQHFFVQYWLLKICFYLCIFLMFVFIVLYLLTNLRDCKSHFTYTKRQNQRNVDGEEQSQVLQKGICTFFAVRSSLSSRWSLRAGEELKPWRWNSNEVHSFY